MSLPIQQWSGGAEVLQSSTMATISLFMEVAKGILPEPCIAWTASTSFAAEGQSYTHRSQIWRDSAKIFARSRNM